MGNLNDEERRVKVSATIDPALLHVIDSFVDTNPTFNRSRVFDEALRLWCECQLEKALEDQFSTSVSGQAEEKEDWRHIRRAAAQRLFPHYERG